MTPFSNIVITRSRLFGSGKNVGGMENYCISFVNELSCFDRVLLIDASGTYCVDQGVYVRTSNGSSFQSAYLLTILIGFKAFFRVHMRDISATPVVYSFGYAGVILSLAKTVGLLAKLKLVVALFGLESVDYSKSTKTLLVKMQYILGIRGFFGSNILRRSFAYLTEFDSHHNVYIEKYPFLEGKLYFCLPDPISVPDRCSVSDTVTKRHNEFHNTKEVKLLSVGRDSSSKRRDISLEKFSTLSAALADIGYKATFIICVPQASDFLLSATRSDRRIKLIIGATDSELKTLRHSCHFCLSTSDQMVPLISVLEDMAQGIIPISTDDLGGSICNRSGVLINSNTQDWVEEIVRLVQDSELFFDKAECAYNASLDFSVESFRLKISAMRDRLKDVCNDNA